MTKPKSTTKAATRSASRKSSKFKSRKRPAPASSKPAARPATKQGLGHEDRQAPRDEEGDRGVGAPVGGDHAPHLGGRHRVPVDPRGYSGVRAVQDQTR